MFISQINSPFKHKEWNLNPHQDESKTKSFQYSVISVFLVTTGFNIKINKDMLFKNHATGFLSSASDLLYADLQHLKNCTSPDLNQVWNSCALNTKQMRNKITRHNQVHNECRCSFRHCRFVDNVLLEHPVSQCR